MELPKNVTQIGEADRHCKIYVEDYCISYIRQMNHMAENKPMGLALYGVRREEGDAAYLFLYGACRLEFLLREARHLSQAQNQEIEKLRKQHFPMYQFLGYLLLNGEMVEGFHICEQGICRYIRGYACFYEKNDAMLAYMLDSRETEAEPEHLDEEKYAAVKQRQQSRRRDYENQVRQGGRSKGSWKEKEALENAAAVNSDAAENLAAAENPTVLKKRMLGDLEEDIPDIQRRRTLGAFKGQASLAGKRKRETGSGNLQLMRASVAGVFLLLCVAGVATLGNHGGLDGLQDAARQVLAELSEQKLPDPEDAVEAMNHQGEQDTLYTGDDLTEAIQKENQGQAEQALEGSNPISQDETQNLSADSPEGSEPAEGQGQPEGSEPAEDQGQPEGSESAEDQGQPEGSGPADDQGQPEGSEPAEDQVQPEGSEPAEGQGQPEGSEPAEGQGQSSEVAALEEALSNSTPIPYTIQKGDTLIGISRAHYGTETKVPEICALNNIANPDDIYFGQKILLP